MNAGPETRDIKIKIKNFGCVTETEIPYTVTATCVDANDNGILECIAGTIIFSAACTGDAAPLAPGQVVTIAGCTVTYTAPTGGDQWLITLMIGHCGSDGTVLTCATNDGQDDANLSNNIATKKVRVLP